MKNILLKAVSVIYIVCILSFVLLYPMLSGELWAKYHTEAGGHSGARVARFSFSAENVNNSESFALDLSDIKYPGTSATFTFVVSNENEKGVSEVPSRILVKLTKIGDLPLTATVKEQGTASSVPLELGTALELTSFTGGSAGEKTFILTVSWPESENDVSLMNEITAVTLSVSAEQID